MRDWHTYKIDEECGVEFVIPYGKSKILQFFYIFNPSGSAYTYWSSVKVKMYNCLWIKDHGKLKYNKKWLKENEL